MSNIAIKAENISKYYRLGQINNGTLFQDIQTWLALKREREDPHSHIGENKYNNDKDGFWALKDINFEIQQGDRVGIIGKNGAGKSTLLKVISEITNPTTGTIKIKGRIASLLEVGTGFHPEMTGRENIYMNGSILGMKKYEIDRKLDEIIDFSEIEQHIDTPVKRYSSGMYVRLAFAVAAHLDSEILIADEVLAVGDASFQKKALGKMSDLSTGQGRTVLFVSHQMNAVKNLCNKGIVLEKGSIIHESGIDSCIQYYLNDSLDNHYSYKWINKDKFSNNIFTPIEISLTDQLGNLPDKSLDAQHSYNLNLKFTCNESTNNLTFEFYFKNMDGTIAFSLSPFYQIEDYKPSLGINHLTCKIPANIFNDKEYIIELQASLHCQIWILEPGKTSPYLYINVNKKFNNSPFQRNSSESVWLDTPWLNMI